VNGSQESCPTTATSPDLLRDIGKATKNVRLDRGQWVVFLDLVFEHAGVDEYVKNFLNAFRRTDE
jgi:hypothetical protein